MVILIPFKADRRKSRLSAILGMEERRRLSELMLLDVLRAFRKAGLLQRCYVITSDEEALSLVQREGAQTITEEEDQGVNAAVRAGMKTLEHSRDVMVVPSDVPEFTADEINDVLDLKSTFGCVVSPSRSFDGTNLLFFSADAIPALSYDSDSFWNHLTDAAKSSISLAVYCGAGIMSDVDTPEDLRALSVIKRRTSSAEFLKEALKRRQS